MNYYFFLILEDFVDKKSIILIKFQRIWLLFLIQSDNFTYYSIIKILIALFYF